VARGIGRHIFLQHVRFFGQQSDFSKQTKDVERGKGEVNPKCRGRNSDHKKGVLSGFRESG